MFSKTHWKAPVMGSFYSKIAGLELHLKVTLSQLFSGEFCQILHDQFFTEHLWATPSVIQQSVKSI